MRKSNKIVIGSVVASVIFSASCCTQVKKNSFQEKPKENNSELRNYHPKNRHLIFDRRTSKLAYQRPESYWPSAIKPYQDDLEVISHKVKIHDYQSNHNDFYNRSSRAILE